MTTLPTGTFDIDTAHSVLGFSVRHAGVARVRGTFTAFSGTLEVAEDFAQSTVSVDIESASVDTGQPGRDEHLRSADFWHAEENPEWTFRTTSVEGSGEEFVVNGDFTANGVTRPVALEAAYHGSTTGPDGKLRLGFSAETSISRKDFELTWNVAMEGGGVLVGDKVKIELDVAAVAQD